VRDSREEVRRVGLVVFSNWASLLSLSCLNRCSASPLARAPLQYSSVWASRLTDTSVHDHHNSETTALIYLQLQSCTLTICSPLCLYLSALWPSSVAKPTTICSGMLPRKSIVTGWHARQGIATNVFYLPNHSLLLHGSCLFDISIEMICIDTVAQRVAGVLWWTSSADFLQI
jgi:hypothetical protein